MACWGAGNQLEEGVEGSVEELGNVEGSEWGKCSIAENKVCVICSGITVTARKAENANAARKV